MSESNAEKTLLYSMPVSFYGPAATSTLLVQSLLRPPQRPYDLTQLRRFQVKPRHQRYQVDLAHDTLSANHDPNAGFPDTFRLTGTAAPDAPHQLCVCMVRHGTLQVMHIDHVVQLRPSFDNLPQHAGSEYGVSVHERTADDEDAMMGDAEEEGDDEVVQVHVQRRESERQTAMRKKSYQYLSQVEATEPWVGCSVSITPLKPTTQPIHIDAHSSSSSASASASSSSSSAANAAAIAASAAKSVVKLVESAAPSSKPEPLLDRIRRIGVLPIEEVPSSIDAATEKSLVRVWSGFCLRSDIMYEKDSRRELARDVLLATLHLTKGQFAASIGWLGGQSGLSDAASETILREVCVWDAYARTWKLRTEYLSRAAQERGDVLMRPPEDAQWDDYWTRRRDYALRLLATNEPQKRAQKAKSQSMSVNLQSSSIGSSASSSSASASQSSSAASVGGAPAHAVRLSGTVSEPGQVNDSLARYLRDYAVGYGALKDRVLEQAILKSKIVVSDADARATVDSLFRSFVRPDVKVLRVTGNGELDEFRTAIINAFEKVFTAEVLQPGEKRVIRKTDIMDAVREATSKDCPANVYTRVCKEIGERHGSAWAPKSGEIL